MRISTYFLYLFVLVRDLRQSTARFFYNSNKTYRLKHISDEIKNKLTSPTELCNDL